MLIVAHPDTQHSVHAAVGLKRAGLLKFLLTAFSLKRIPGFAQVARLAAPRAYARLAQHRLHAELDRSEIRIFPSHLLAMRAGERAWAASQRRFGRLAGHLGERSGCGVICFDSNALETFKILKKAGLPAILDQTIAHRRWSNRVAAEESERFPEWGGSWASPAWREVSDDEELALADVVLCGSRFCAQTLEDEGVSPAKLRVVEYGADTTRFHPSHPHNNQRHIRLLFVGALTLRKGLPYLLEAVKRVAPIGVTITLAGVSLLRPGLLARYDGFAQHQPFQLQELMPSLYQQHDIYVFPSLVEGSSLSIYEAMASGLPVITTPNAGSTVENGVTGLLVPPRDVEALAFAIESLAKDPERRRAMGQAARRRALQTGDWRHYGQRLSEAVSNYAGEKGGRKREGAI